MANSLYNSLNPLGGMMKQLQEFQQNFKGNPRSEVENLLKSGRMSQQEFNNLSMQAQQILRLITS